MLTRADTVVLGVFGVGAVAAVVFLSAMSGNGSSDTPPQANPSAIASATAGVDDQAISPTTPLSRALEQRAGKVVRLYVTYPNSAGTQATLEKLRPLVDEPVLRIIAAEWQGPEVTTASAEVTALKFLSTRYLTPKHDKVIMQAQATQKVSFVNTPVQSTDLLVNILLHRVGKIWHVSGLSLVNDDDS